MNIRFRATALVALMFVSASACTRPSAGPAAEAADTGRVVGRYDGGVITEAELIEESSRLPSPLREQFERPAGQREFVRSMIDKRLLAQEARSRGLHQEPSIQKQVKALEDRLTIQALLAAEEKAAGKPGEEELRGYYAQHRESFAQPERLRLGRVWVSLPSGATAAQRAQAKQKAERFAQRLKAGEPLAKVAAEGDGPEKAQGGELGVVARGELPDRTLEDAAFALKKPGETSGVIAGAQGYSVVRLLERREGRTPAFEEVRAEVESRVLPQWQRKVLESLLARLRASGSIGIDVPERL
ncbi:peptidyl-prolyl cis-trans isomerase [Pyxidicoccus parkwayensis]|uniref:Peptidyl-prolyl cis-trans isomerase n=1 Tax=Pyxidicoccus parkwayensis TaxID=2813578 RepID=A0ABX7P827_9BACT|nr:peptidylprolyl isomerase [Pyxidicoccus parkwaysis]QSQ26565.1 peptidyl-prolyl cis-trans isomerase [Pyxidicoccus parkwaysis]